jgi:alpha-amylase
MRAWSTLIRRTWITACITALLATVLIIVAFVQVAPTAQASAPNPSRSVYVHLFEWKWADIANECETWLGTKGFGAVQVSPPNDHARVTSPNRPWWEVYQPVSYQLVSRMGDRAAFANMVTRCRTAGVEVYADVVFNHMAAISTNTSTAGNAYSKYNYPAVSYSTADFHWYAPAPNGCQSGISNYQDRFNVQFCELVGLPDLRTETTTVRGKIADYLVDLYNLGVRGYRIDAAKHMPASDVAAILANVNSRVELDPYIVQEVIDRGGEPITKSEYYATGDVNEFNYGPNIANSFRSNIANLQTFGENWGMAPSSEASVFIDNHDMQRGGGGGGYLTYKDGTRYDLANVFMLAWPYGYPQVMSSFAFTVDDQGPPSDGNGLPTTPGCGGTWVCEHRHRAIANMVAWRNTAASATTVTNWWSNGGNQIAFGRGNRGFVAINNDGSQTLNQTLQTGMAAGTYCNVITGDFTAPNNCSGSTITVNTSGQAALSVGPMSAAAIHVGAMMSGGATAIPTRTPTPPPGGNGSPWNGTPAAIPGTVQAENFNTGGEGVAYHDLEMANQGGQYRTSEGVDIETTSDTGGGYNVGWMRSGEWMKYTVNVTSGTSYTANFRVASAATTGAFYLEVDGANVTGTITVPNTGGWPTYQTITRTSINLTSGQHLMRVVTTGNDVNLNWFSFAGGTNPTLTPTRTPTAGPTPTRTPTPTGNNGSPWNGTPVNLPGTVQAENYNTGGEGIAYHDLETANSGGQYRTTEGVDIEGCSDTGCGYNVGWMRSGEWTKYTVNVPTAGSRSIDFRVASGVTTGAFHLEVDGVNVTGTVTVPNTGGWQSWQTITRTGVNLTSGQHVLRLVVTGNDVNLNWIQFR